MFNILIQEKCSTYNEAKFFLDPSKQIICCWSWLVFLSCQLSFDLHDRNKRYDRAECVYLTFGLTTVETRISNRLALHEMKTKGNTIWCYTLYFMNHMHGQREADLLEVGRGEEKRKSPFLANMGLTSGNIQRQRKVRSWKKPSNGCSE